METCLAVPVISDLGRSSHSGARKHRAFHAPVRAYLLSARSVLLPTSMMITSLPLSVLTSSIHLEVCWKELRSGGRKWGQSGI